MPNPPTGMHLCPTRANDEPVLIAHMITFAMCQQRQREHFHKCPTCVHNNERNIAAPMVLASASQAAKTEAKVAAV